MRIKELTLYTNMFEKEKLFYTQILGLDLTHISDSTFTVIIGWSKLTFKKSETKHIYHYCFLIPSNQLCDALAWFEDKTQVLELEKGKKTQRFDSWNAESFYFYDGSGNLAECIVRYDLENASDNPFDQASLLCVNEIGMPTKFVDQTNTFLSQKIGTRFWKGDLERFGTNGSQEGLFLLPNYEIKKNWFPTDLRIISEPFRAIIEVKGVEKEVDFPFVKD